MISVLPLKEELKIKALFGDLFSNLSGLIPFIFVFQLLKKCAVTVVS